MKLQLTIDHGKRHEVIAMVDLLADHVRQHLNMPLLYQIMSQDD